MKNRFYLTAILLTLASGSGSVGAASLDEARLILIKKSTSGYKLEAYDSNASFHSTPKSIPIQTEDLPLPRDSLRAFGSDGEQFFTITREGNYNCFSRYSSVQYLRGGIPTKHPANTPPPHTPISTPYSKNCKESDSDDYRGIMRYLNEDGILKYATVSYANRKTSWAVYDKWENLVKGEPNKPKNGEPVYDSPIRNDIYKGIAYNKSTGKFLSFAQNGNIVYHLTYPDFNSLQTVTRTERPSYNFQTSEIFAGAAFAPTTDVMEIVLAAGQSNAVGWDTDVDRDTGIALGRRPANGTRPGYTTTNDNIKFAYDIGSSRYNNENSPAFVSSTRTQSPSLTDPSIKFLDTLKPQENKFTNKGSRPYLYVFGIEQAAQHMKQPDRKLPFGVLKVAFGSSNLYRQWTSPLMSTPTSRDAVNLSLLDVLKEDLAVMKSKANQRVRVVGLLWMQGEADASDTSKKTDRSGNIINDYGNKISKGDSSWAAKQYKKNFEKLYREMEILSGTDCLPTVAGLIRSNWQHAKIVTDAIKDFKADRPTCIATADANTTGITTVEPESLYNPTGLSVWTDGAHLDNQGAWEFGILMGNAYESLRD